jgi:lipopolysaccharide/colanic/teichoic acid biosynthesis glycosyltransferase
MYSQFIKPTLDFLISLIGLVFLSPILLLVTLLLAIANKGKPFFFQSRPGKNGKIFRIVKFKTMNEKRGPDGVPFTKMCGFI